MEVLGEIHEAGQVGLQRCRVAAQFVAEGRPGAVDGAPGYRVIFTSVLDDRYGAGGTFDTTENGFDPTFRDPATSPQPGDWGGLYFGPASRASVDQAVIAFGGTVEYFVSTVFNYPTLAECYKVAALNGLNRLHAM